jgi:hypothetical protein
VTYNGFRRRAPMSQRPSHALEVHVSFEVNRLAPVYLVDAYELLIPPVSERKPVDVAASLLSPPQEKQATEEKAV